MGSPEFAIIPLQLLILNGHAVSAVYTRTDKPGGRGRAPLPPPIKEAALSLNLPVIQLPGLKKPEAIAQLAQFKPEAIVVAAFGQILPQDVLDIPCYGCINIHPSLLPRYRGASPVAAAVLSGDEFAGVSVMRLDAGMDTGPVFSRAQIPILPYDTAGSLTKRLFQIGGWMLIEVLANLPGGNLLPEPQNASEATYTHEITKEEGKINWQLTAAEIWRMVRAYQPWPEAYTLWQGKQLKVIEAFPVSVRKNPEAGQVIELSPAGNPVKAAVGVGTGQGVLGLLKVQMEGKRAMLAADFIRGQRAFIGSILS
jgi:methionyl-tRNA formyltransferase